MKLNSIISHWHQTKSRRLAVFEIKVSYCAHSGCIGSQNCAPGSLSMCSSLYKDISML